MWRATPMCSISRGRDACGLHHQHDCALARTRSVHDAPRHHHALAWFELDRAALEIEQQRAFEDEEQLVLLVTLSLTTHRLWFHQGSLFASTSAPASTTSSGPHFTSVWMSYAMPRR